MFGAERNPMRCSKGRWSEPPLYAERWRGDKIEVFFFYFLSSLLSWRIRVFWSLWSLLSLVDDGTVYLSISFFLV